MDHLSQRARQVLLPAAATAMAVASLATLFFLTRAIYSVNKEIQELQEKARDLAAQPRVSPTRQSLGELEEFLAIWRNGQIPAEEISQLVATLGEAAQKHQVRLAEYRPKPWTRMSWLRTCEIRVQVTGTTDAILRWIYDISKKGYPLVFKQCAFEKSPGDGDSGVRCSLEFAVYSENSGQ